MDDPRVMIRQMAWRCVQRSRLLYVAAELELADHLDEWTDGHPGLAGAVSATPGRSVA